MPGATEEFKRRLREAFDEMSVGQTFTFRRIFTDGDYNPYHQDESFVKESPHGRLTIPGLFTGSMLTHIDSLLGYLATQRSFEYLAPVFVGDTLTCTVTIAEKNEEKRRISASAGFVNQDAVKVLRASFSSFPGRVRLAR